MNQGTLLDEIRIIPVSNAIAAGTGTTNMTGVDLSANGGYDGVLFLVKLGTIVATGTNVLKAQSSSDNAVADAYADIANSTTTSPADTDDNGIIALDVNRPPEPWVRAVLTRATANTTIECAIAILYRGKKLPTAQLAAAIVASLKCIEQPNA